MKPRTTGRVSWPAVVALALGPLLVVGLLLGFAFGRQGADKRLDELVSRLERV